MFRYVHRNLRNHVHVTLLSIRILITIVAPREYSMRGEFSVRAKIVIKKWKWHDYFLSAKLHYSCLMPFPNHFIGSPFLGYFWYLTIVLIIVTQNNMENKMIIHYKGYLISQCWPQNKFQLNASINYNYKSSPRSIYTNGWQCCLLHWHFPLI